MHYQYNHHHIYMLPMMWNQPPCMNIDVNSDLGFGVPSNWQARRSLSAMAVPGSTLLSRSAGIKPYRHRDSAIDCGLPAP